MNLPLMDKEFKGPITERVGRTSGSEKGMVEEERRQESGHQNVGRRGPSLGGNFIGLHYGRI